LVAFGWVYNQFCSLHLQKNRDMFKYFVLVLLCITISQLSFSQRAALNFDGTDDCVLTNYNAISGKAARTTEAWIKTTANCDPNNAGKQKVILDCGSTATGGRFTLNLLWSNAIRIEIGGSGLSGKTALNDGNWHHVAAVFNPADSNRYSLFVDGKLDVAGFITTAINTSASNNLMIGKRVDNINYFEGEIDEVRVYDYAKSDSLIKADMNKEFCVIPKGLVAYYKLNDGNPGSNNTSKTTAFDKSGNGNNGTLNGFALSGASSNWVNGVSLLGGATQSTIQVFECSNYTSPSGRYNWGIAGTYRDTLVNSNQCDSIITIVLTLGKSYNYTSGNGCDSFVSAGMNTYYTSGTYIENYKSIRGCDSIISIDVIINKSYLLNQMVSACDSFVSSGGITYLQSGQFIEKYNAINGCDSIINYQIQIDKSKVTYDSLTTCDSAFINGEWYNKSALIKIASKTLSNCDSTHYIQLTINNSFLQMNNAVACDSFFAKNGKFYTQSGQFIEALKSSKGCDSTHIYNFKVYKSSITPLVQTTCDSGYIYGKWYYQDTIVKYTLQSIHGCDSLIVFSLDATDINKEVTIDNYTLTASENADSYSWLDCSNNQAIVGANSKTFIAPRAGSYAVVLELNDCIDTSNCYVVKTGGLNKSVLECAIQPNPSHGDFEIKLNNTYKISSVKIYDQLGRIVHQNTGNNASTIQVKSDLLKGIYFIHLSTNYGNLNQKIIIE
jgi:hypothetical protein